MREGNAHDAPLIETARRQPQAVKVISDVGDEVAVRVLNNPRLYHGAEKEGWGRGPGVVMFGAKLNKSTARLDMRDERRARRERSWQSRYARPV